MRRRGALPNISEVYSTATSAGQLSVGRGIPLRYPPENSGHSVSKNLNFLRFNLNFLGLYPYFEMFSILGTMYFHERVLLPLRCGDGLWGGVLAELLRRV